MANKPKLTLKQEKFVAAYLGAANGNATEAARMAGYKQPAVYGQQLLRKTYISARIKAQVAEYAGTSKEVLDELASVAFAPWIDFVEVVGRTKDGEVTKVRSDIGSKVKALELLGKYHQLFIEKQQIDVNIREHRVLGVAQEDLDAMFAPAKRAELHA